MQSKMFSRQTLCLFLCLLLVTLSLAGCGDKEPEQRKAFISFLETRLKAPSVSVPALSEAELKAVGPYAEHYAVIRNFHAGMDKVMADIKIQDMAQTIGIRSISDMVAKRGAIAEFKTKLELVKKSLPELMGAANTASKALKQPDDLKAVFAKVYDKTVTDPGTKALTAFAAADNTLGALTDTIKYIDDNKSTITLSGNSASISDPAVQNELNTKIQKIAATVKQTQAAMQALAALIR